MILALFFHVIALSATACGIFYDFKNIKFPETDFQWHHPFGGKFKFLTIQNMDIYFSGLAFPLAVFITINFWVFYLTRRDQILPQPIREIIPKWHLHVLHTNATVFMLMEAIICFHNYPEFCTGLVTILTYMSTYILWLHTIRYFAGFWVYPVFNDKTLKELFTYFGSALLQCVIIYMLEEILNNALWASMSMEDGCPKHQT